MLFERRVFHSTFALDDQKEGMGAFVEKAQAGLQAPVSATGWRRATQSRDPMRVTHARTPIDIVRRGRSRSRVLLAGCASTTLQSTWRDPALPGRARSSKVFVLALSTRDVTARRVLEDVVVAKLQAGGVEAVPAWQFLPNDGPAGESALDGGGDRSGADAMLMVRLLGVDTQLTVWPPPMGPGPRFGWYGYYSGWYAYRRSRRRRSRWSERRCSTCEAQRVVWSATSETINPTSVQQDAPGFADVIARVAGAADCSLPPPSRRRRDEQQREHERGRDSSRPGGTAAARPTRRVEPFAFAEVALLHLAQLRAHAAVVREQHDLGVERERADVHVRRADPRDVVVDRRVLRVQKALAVAADLARRCVEQLPVVGLLRVGHRAAGRPAPARRAARPRRAAPPWSAPAAARRRE